MDAAVSNAASQAQGLAVTFQTPLAIFLGVVLFSIACAIAIEMIWRAGNKKDAGGMKEGRDYDYIWKDGRVAGARKRR